MANYQETTRYDSGEMRQSVRFGRERGVRVSIPAAVLRAAGIDPAGPPPPYKLWANGDKGSTVWVKFYRT